MHELSMLVGVTYRVAYLTARGPGEKMGSCTVYSGNAALYNPARLVNQSQFDPGSVAHDIDQGLADIPHFRRSLPICNRTTNWMPLPTLIDGPPQLDKCSKATPSGPSYATFPDTGHLVSTYIRLAFVDDLSEPIDIINIHSNDRSEVTSRIGIKRLVDQVTHPVHRAGVPLYPLIMAGDFNADANITDGFPDFRPVAPVDIMGNTADYGDVMAVALSKQDISPFRHLANVVETRIVPDWPDTVPDKPCGPIRRALTEYLISDHCGIFVRLDIDANDDGSFRGAFIDGPASALKGQAFTLQATPSGGGPQYKYLWHPGSGTSAQMTSTAGDWGTQTNWSVDVTDVAVNRTFSAQYVVSVPHQQLPSPCKQQCEDERTACLRTASGTQAVGQCYSDFRTCSQACDP
jgi:hypothetical protein